MAYNLSCQSCLNSQVPQRSNGLNSSLKGRNSPISHLFARIEFRHQVHCFVDQILITTIH